MKVTSTLAQFVEQLTHGLSLWVQILTPLAPGDDNKEKNMNS